MLSSLINKFVRLCELRHGLSTGATCTNTNLKRRQQQRSFNLFLLIFSTSFGYFTHYISPFHKPSLPELTLVNLSMERRKLKLLLPGWDACLTQEWGVGKWKMWGTGGKPWKIRTNALGKFIREPGWTRLTFPSIDSGEANMLFFETPFKLFPDLLEPPPYNRDTNMHAPI